MFWRLAVSLVGLATAVPLMAGEVADVAALIDRRISERLRQEQVTPAPSASDAEFQRRAWLDVAGKIPPASEVRRFLADSSPNKRARLVEQLLRDEASVRHFTTFWREILLPELKSDELVQQLVPGFDAWLQQHLRYNTPYDQLVREVITTRLSLSGRDASATQGGTERSAIAFYQAKEIAPANLAAATSRIFLGIRLECAQCHDHPFDHWTQPQFWSFAAFFAGIERPGENGVLGRVEEVFDRRELLIPNSETVVQAGFLDGRSPRWRRGITSRQILADWITSPANPYFARMAVNRVWGKFLGVGLVDPVDDFTASNACSHPELLDELARELVAHQFDLKFLIRAITMSETYQRSSVRGPRSKTSEDVPAQLYATWPVKGLTAEQLLDSLLQAGALDSPNRLPAASGGPMSPTAEILELFANDTDPPTSQQTSILQSLALMNGGLVAAVIDPQQNPNLAALASSPGGDAQRVDALFLATLSRFPTEEESRRLVKFVADHKPDTGGSNALTHVLWALLNSAEFCTNH